MNASGDGERDGTRPSEFDEAALAARREALDAELRARQHHLPPEPAGADETPAAGWARGVRLASDFVAGVLVGGAIGWFIDRLLGSFPWGLLICLLFGFAAGTLTAMRSAGMVNQADYLRRNRGK